MDNVFVKLKWAWRDARKIKTMANDFITNNSSYLKEGVWKIYFGDGKPFLVRTPGKGLDFYRSYRQKYSGRLRTIRDLLQNLICSGWKYRCHSDGSSAFLADCILINTSGWPCFFDLQKMVVKKYNPRGSTGYFILKNAGYWDVFQTPVLNIEGNSSYEKVIISGKKTVTETEQLKYILHKYKEYFSAIRPVERHTVAEIAVPYRKYVPEFDKIFTQSILELSLNYYVQHCDCTWDNLICSETGDRFVIDYEWASAQPFFFDILFFSLFRGCKHGDWYLLDELLNPSTETAKMYDSILKMQGIPTNRAAKIALVILTRFKFLSILIKHNYHNYLTERATSDFFIQREIRIIKNLIEHFSIA